MIATSWLVACAPGHFGRHLQTLIYQRIRGPVSTKTFDEIQAALVEVGKFRKNRVDKGFLFLNFAKCGTCGRCVTGECHIKWSGRR